LRKAELAAPVVLVCGETETDHPTFVVGRHGGRRLGRRVYRPKAHSTCTSTGTSTGRRPIPQAYCTGVRFG
jgi:hypothetical protein